MSGLYETIQDIVPRSGKMVFFKRGGHLVMINELGDMLVRPPIIEASMRQMPGGVLSLSLSLSLSRTVHMQNQHQSEYVCRNWAAACCCAYC